MLIDLHNGETINCEPTKEDLLKNNINIYNKVLIITSNKKAHLMPATSSSGNTENVHINTPLTNLSILKINKFNYLFKLPSILRIMNDNNYILHEKIKILSYNLKIIDNRNDT